MATDYAVLISIIGIGGICIEIAFLCFLELRQSRTDRKNRGCKWYRLEHHDWVNYSVNDKKMWGFKYCNNCYDVQKRFKD